MKYSPITEDQYNKYPNPYISQFKKSPTRMALYDYNNSNETDENIQLCSKTSDWFNQTTYKYGNIKRLPQSYSTLRQTFDASGFQNMKYSSNNENRRDKNQIQDNLRKTVHVPYRKLDQQSQFSYTVLARSTYKSKNTKEKIQQKLNQYHPSTARNTYYDSITEKVNENANMLIQLKKLKSSPKYQYNHKNPGTYQNNTQPIVRPTVLKDKVRQLKSIENIKNAYIPQNKQIHKQLTKSEYSPKYKPKPQYNQINGLIMGKILGEGKFGKVYLAKHKLTNSIFAVKKMSKKVIKQNMMIDQFIQEIKLQSFFNNKNIVKLYGFFNDKQNIYLIMEYMEEGTLFSYLKKSKTLSEDQVSTKLIDVSQAIKYMHENGVAHRDIKPQNVVMSYSVCKICDFGWAAVCKDRRKTYCGTFDYAAPQIIQGVQYDMSVDLWCLGVLAYELLVGKAPFYHISRKQTVQNILNVQGKPIKYPENISKNAISFIQHLVRKDPQDRMKNSQILNHPFLMQNMQKNKII